MGWKFTQILTFAIVVATYLIADKETQKQFSPLAVIIVAYAAAWTITTAPTAFYDWLLARKRRARSHQ